MQSQPVYIPRSGEGCDATSRQVCAGHLSTPIIVLVISQIYQSKMVPRPYQPAPLPSQPVPVLPQVQTVAERPNTAPLRKLPTAPVPVSCPCERGMKDPGKSISSKRAPDYQTFPWLLYIVCLIADTEALRCRSSVCTTRRFAASSSVFSRLSGLDLTRRCLLR